MHPLCLAFLFILFAHRRKPRPKVAFNQCEIHCTPNPTQHASNLPSESLPPRAAAAPRSPVDSHNCQRSWSATWRSYWAFVSLQYQQTSNDDKNAWWTNTDSWKKTIFVPMLLKLVSLTSFASHRVPSIVSTTRWRWWWNGSKRPPLPFSLDQATSRFFRLATV